MKFLSTHIIFSFLFTIGLFGQSYLIAPSNLQATINGNDVQLTWSPPDTANSLYLSWDNGITGNSIGLTGAGNFSVAAKWDSVALIPYQNYNISKIAFFLSGESSTYTAYVWQGPNADSTIFSEPVTPSSNSDWTYVYPNSPVSFSSLQDLWVGYEVSQSITDFPAGTDIGPAVQGYGDLINYEGNWVSMSQVFGLDYNFNIRVYLSSTNGESIVLDNFKKKSTFNYSNSKQISFKESTNEVITSSINSTSAIIGYNVYKNNELLTPVPVNDTILVDPSLDFGIYNYSVTAVYEEGESSPTSVTAQIGNPEMVIFPEEIVDTVIIGNYYEKIITVFNEGNVDLFGQRQAMPTGHS